MHSLCRSSTYFFISNILIPFLQFGNTSAKQGLTEPIDSHTILAEHGNVYTTPDGNDEDLIDNLAEFPLQDRRGESLPIFDVNGNSITRMRARPLPGAQSAALFLALEKAKTLFRNHPVSTRELPYVRGNNVDKYPIAHLPNIGCIQTRQPLPLFHPIVQRINRRIGRVITPDEDEHIPELEVDEDGDIINHDGVQKHPIFGTHTQCYNLSTHHFAPRANEFRVLHGQVGAAASSWFPLNATTRQRGQTAVQKIAAHLPFEALEAQIESGNVPTMLRLEQVFVVNLSDMDDQYKTGQ
jgi:hypothetical protein